LVRGLNITARFARGAKVAEVNGFSIAVERTAMEKHSAVFAAEKARADKLYQDLICNSETSIAEGVSHFAFRRLPAIGFASGEAGGSQRKAKLKTTTLRSSRLCGETLPWTSCYGIIGGLKDAHI
jgi:hypothetical protein